MKPRGDGGAADGKMPAQLGSCAGIALSAAARTAIPNTAQMAQMAQTASTAR